MVHSNECMQILQEKYKDRIAIFCGLELDLFSVTDLSPFDYVIGSVHYLKRNGEYIGFDRNLQTVQAVIDTYFGCLNVHVGFGEDCATLLFKKSGQYVFDGIEGNVICFKDKE